LVTTLIWVLDISGLQQENWRNAPNTQNKRLHTAMSVLRNIHCHCIASLLQSSPMFLPKSHLVRNVASEISENDHTPSYTQLIKNRNIFFRHLRHILNSEQKQRQQAAVLSNQTSIFRVFVHWAIRPKTRWMNISKYTSLLKLYSKIRLLNVKSTPQYIPC
jgi:hypothetical protein